MDSRSNTLARFKLLTKALQGSTNVPASLVGACRSQGGLAKFSYPSEGIEPMALNTLKSSAEQFIEDGGWAKLDAMRKSYMTSGKFARGRSGDVRKNARSQKEKLTELATELNVERRYRIRLQTAYEALLAHLRFMAKNDPEIGHFINRHVTGFSFKRLTTVNKDADVTTE